MQHQRIIKLPQYTTGRRVTAPQLSMLEATMAKMERVAVWSLMSGGGSGRDVFTVSVSSCGGMLLTV
jgi:hypothetical protein